MCKQTYQSSRNKKQENHSRKLNTWQINPCRYVRMQTAMAELMAKPKKNSWAAKRTCQKKISRPPQEKRPRPPRHLRQEGLEGRDCLTYVSCFSHTHTLLSSTPALHAAIKKTVKSKNQYLARWEGSHTHTQTKAGRREEARGRTKGGGARSTGVQRRRYNLEVPDRGHIEHTKQKK